MLKNINHQQIYEEEINDSTKEQGELESRFYELAHPKRVLVEELIEAGYRRALADALDPEILSETAVMAGEMGTQMYNFANLVQSFLADNPLEDEEA